jgi:hypothetical protein
MGLDKLQGQFRFKEKGNRPHLLLEKWAVMLCRCMEMGAWDTDAVYLGKHHQLEHGRTIVT